MADTKKMIMWWNNGGMVNPIREIIPLIIIDNFCLHTFPHIFAVLAHRIYKMQMNHSLKLF